MIIYADILFLINFIMDYITLYVCGTVLNLRKKLIRLIISAIIGGIYCVAELYIKLPNPYTAIAVSLLMCAVAYGKTGKLLFLKILLLFYSVGMLSGGAAVFIYGIFYRNRDAGIFSSGLKLWMMFAFAAVLTLFFMFLGKVISSFTHEKNVEAEISFDGKTVNCRLLCDSGNLLCDPYTGLPVIILGKEKLDNLYCGNISERCKEDSGLAVKYKFRYIPVKTAIGGGILPAFSADSIKIINPNGKTKQIDACIAGESGNGSRFSGFDGIIPLSALHGT